MKGVFSIRAGIAAGMVVAGFGAGTGRAEAQGETVIEQYVPVALLRAGTNVVAVELHQQEPTTSDARFDFAFYTTTNPAPIIQNNRLGPLTSTNAIVRASLVSTAGAPTTVTAFWGEHDAGPSPAGWTRQAGLGTLAAGSVDARLDGLAPGTRYYCRLRAGNADGEIWTDPAVTFISAPRSETWVPWGSVWRYLDNGSDQGTAWRAAGFDDSAWAAGPAQSGYGEGDEATTVGYGGVLTNKFITTYFRRAFDVADPTALASMTINLIRDDGAVLYLNGQELLRDNLPAGPVTAATFALTGISGAAESQVQTWTRPVSVQPGTNVLAVEIHQDDRLSSDISFDLQLRGQSATQPAVTRGPYLQLGTPHAMTVRWRTDVPTNSFVRWRALTDGVTNTLLVATNTTEHVVTVTNLQPATRYVYAVGTGAQWLSVEEEGNTFLTAPVPGTPLRTRIWAIGDFGTADAAARAVRDGYAKMAAGGDTHVWLMLGDNAYPSGTDAEYQAAVFNTYPDLLRRTVAWPTLGNHETYNGRLFSDLEVGPYYDMFTLPRAGEAGGLPSGTEAFYSFDYANIHFICLNSMDVDRSVQGVMMTWLENDLKATDQEWIIAYWHHPPYSKGSHDSDNLIDSEGRMRDMRAIALPILESNRVDLVLSGHSHVYERSFFIHGHYDFSWTFNTNTMLIDGGDGREDGDGAYGRTGPTGAVYTVCGSSGALGSGALNHPAMYVSMSMNGSLAIDVEGRALRASFVDASGRVRDHFAIMHGDGRLGNDDGEFPRAGPPDPGRPGGALMGAGLAPAP